MNQIRFTRVFSTAVFVLLTSCASNENETIIYSGDSGESYPEYLEEVVQTEEGPLSSDDPFIRQRIMADMLYEARLAYEDNRLQSPPGNNAYDMFRAILDFDPDNEVALQGIRDIVLRYIELADAAMNVRQYDNAEALLRRAASIDQQSEDVANARRQLEQARNIQMEIFALDAEQITDRSLEIMVELGEIGQYIQEKEATFLINARTDEEGRWIYRIMREAVGGYRLRGNIAVDSEPSIQVVIPTS